MERLVLIDAYGHIYRSFYGLRELTNAHGQPANALFALARFFLQLEESLPSAHGAVVFDQGRCRRRCGILAEYKAQRPPMPEALRSQIAPIRDWMEAFGWPLLSQDGQEADDLMGALAVSCPQEWRVEILSFDKDLAQLVTERINILTPGSKGQWQRLDVAGVEAKYGLRPEQLVDYLSLLGDSADNIPGVAGVGPKTAVSLLSSYGNWEGICGKLAQMPAGKLRERLAQAGEQMQRNRQLVQLDLALPAAWGGLPSLERRQPDWARLLKLSEEQGFASLSRQFQKRLAAGEGLDFAAPAAEVEQGRPEGRSPRMEGNGQLLLF